MSQAVVIPGAGIVASGYPGAYPGAYPAAYPAYPGVARLGSPLGYPAIAKVAKVAAPIDDYDPNPQYSYSYDIHVSDCASQCITQRLFRISIL